MANSDPYQPATGSDSSEPVVRPSILLGGVRPAIVVSVIGGLACGWSWMFLPTTNYDLAISALATPLLFVIGLTVLLAVDRRIAWSGAKFIRNVLLALAMMVVGTILFFPACTGTVILLDPVPDANLVYRWLGLVALTVAFMAAFLLTAKSAASSIHNTDPDALIR